MTPTIPHSRHEYNVPILQRPALASITVAVQYCYSAVMEDMDKTVPIFAIMPHFEEELELVSKYPLHITSEPQKSICRYSARNTLLYCCDQKTLSNVQTAIVFPYVVGLGVSIRNYRLIAIKGIPSENITDAEEHLQELLDKVTEESRESEESNTTILLLRFQIGKQQT